MSAPGQHTLHEDKGITYNETVNSLEEENSQPQIEMERNLGGHLPGVPCTEMTDSLLVPS